MMVQLHSCTIPCDLNDLIGIFLPHLAGGKAACWVGPRGVGVKGGMGNEEMGMRNGNEEWKWRNGNE